MLEKEKEKEETSFKKVFSNPKNDITWYQSIGLTLCFGLIYASIFGNPFATSKNEIDNAVTVIQSPVLSYLINTNQKKTYDMVISDFKSSVDSAFIITKNLDINKSEEELKKLIFNNSNMSPTYLKINKETNVIELGLLKNSDELFNKMTVKTNVKNGAVNLSFINSDRESIIVENEMERLLAVVRESMGNSQYAIQWKIKPGNQYIPSSLDISILNLNDGNISKNKNSNVIVKKVGNDKYRIEIKSEQVKK